MPESTFPFGMAAEPEEPEAQVGRTRRRAPLLLGGAAVLAAGLAAAYLSIATGGDDGTAALPIAPPRPVPSAAAVPSATASPSPAGEAVVPASFDVAARDPFRALYTAPAAPLPTAGGSGGGGGGTVVTVVSGGGTSGLVGSGPGSTGGSASPQPAPSSPPSAQPAPVTSASPSPAAATTSSQGHVVSLLTVGSKNGSASAETKVDGVSYSAAVGETFATTFKLLAVDGTCATYLNGDERFDLCEGQEVLK